MASLRMEKNRLRFRLKANEMEQLNKDKQLTVHNPVGGLGFFVGEKRSMQLQEGGFYALFITMQDIKNLQDMRPSKEGLIFRQDGMDIHFELDIKKTRMKTKKD